jgi:hypothetical protein
MAKGDLFAPQPDDLSRRAAIAELRALASRFRGKQVESTSLVMSTSLGWCAARTEDRIDELEQGAPLHI